MMQTETLAVGMVERRKSRQIQLGRVAIGGDAPVSVQSMTTTKTADIDATLQQIASLVAAGVDIVRVAVPHWEDAGRALRPPHPSSRRRNSTELPPALTEAGRTKKRDV